MAKTHLQRIKKENKKLNKKLLRLHHFIESDEFTTLFELNQNLLITQLTIMAAYSNILGTQIDLAEPTTQEVYH